MRARIPILAGWTLWTSVALLSSGVVAQVSTGAARDQQAQIEKGRQVVAQACPTCHTTLGRMLQVHKHTAEQWKDTVYFMISRGAQVMPDEIEPVTAFLAATAGSGSQIATQTSGRGRAAGGGLGQQPAEADGRAIFQRNCQQCHELATASKKPASDDWRAVVTRMVTYGARLTSADQQTLVGYLNGLEK